MAKCRICLETFEDLKMISFDDKLLLYYNLITSLEVQFSEVLGQKLCEVCFKTINLFVEFRNKCLIANSIFQSDNVFEENIKKENGKQSLKSNACDKVKIEIEKFEVELDKEFSLGETELNDNFEYEFTPCKLENVEVKQKQAENLSNRLENFNCGLCDKLFDEKSLMANHLDSDHKSNDFMCSLCFEKFIDWPQLFSHRIKHLPPKQKQCHSCFRKFNSTLRLEQHYKSFHSDEVFLSYCQYCSKGYKTPLRLRKHIAMFHTNKQFICDYCSKVCKNKDSLKIHIRVHTDSKPYACDQCEYSCKQLSGLKIHKLFKHSSKKFKCKPCTRIFASQVDLEKHQCTQKLCICSICGKTFEGNKRMQRHMRSHDSERRYHCARCPAQYRSQAALRAHCDRHDGVRSKRCEYCAKTFVTDSVLIKHRRTHTGVKPYVCKICQKAFTGNNNLKVHMRVHGEYLVKKRDKSNTDENNAL